MFQYRQILARLRQGDTDREIARSGLIGRRKLVAFRALCQQEGWLEPTAALPEDSQLVAPWARPDAHAPPSLLRKLIGGWSRVGSIRV